MKKYFLNNGTENLGPFDIEELKEKNIIRETPIWYSGLANWTTAENIEELKDLLVSVPPIFKKAEPTTSHILAVKSNKRNTNITMKILSITSIVISLLLLTSSIFFAQPDSMLTDNELRLLFHLFLSIYFLTFSIIATIKSFKTK